MKRILFLLAIALVLNGHPAARAAETFRTDINPALIYWQAFGEWPPSTNDFQVAIQGGPVIN